MAKYAIECPHCGRYAEARKGWLFGSKKVTCSCGYEIDVKAAKLASRTCGKCGNTVVYDQSLGEKARCPVCGAAINTPELRRQTVEIHCGQCGLAFATDKDCTVAACPICGHENQVAAALEAEKLRAAGKPVVIRYEGAQGMLVWKHPFEDVVYGSQLIVHEGQEAIFFRDGQALDSFGPGRHLLQTQRMPLLSRVAEPVLVEGEPFHSEIYYVNQLTVMGLKWGTDSRVRLFDPASGLHIALGASGEFNLQVVDARRLLLRIIGTGRDLQAQEVLGGDDASGKSYFRALVMTQVKSGLARCIRERAINILEIDEHLSELSEALRVLINGELAKYGVEISEFMVSRVLTPDDDPAFQRLRKQHADFYLSVREEEIRKREAEARAERRMVEASTEARLRVIEAGGEAEALRLRAATEAEKMRLQGYSYQQETQRAIGLEAMKHGLTGGNGGGAPSAIGELAGLGVALGAMGNMAQIARESLTPGLPAAGGIAGDAWQCPKCGAQGVTTPFCPACGTAKPQPTPPAGWQCPKCGAQGVTTPFCPACGTAKPQPTPPAGWQCPKCGAQGVTTPFCPTCGTAKPGDMP